jgi:hypothetical protein
MKVVRRARWGRVRKPPMEETAGGVERPRVRRYGDLTAVVPECEYNFCDMARTLRAGENAFRHPCNFKELRVVKRGTYYNLCVMCLLAAFVPHRPIKYFHVTASNGIVSNSPSARDHDCISNRIGSGIRSAMQMSSRYVRCAPNAVDDRTDHHADRSSTSGPSSSGKTLPSFHPLLARPCSSPQRPTARAV